MKSCYQLTLGFRQIKGCPVALSYAANEKEDKANGLFYNETIRLCLDDLHDVRDPVIINTRIMDNPAESS